MTSRSRPRWRLSRRARAASCAIERPPVSSTKNGRFCNSIESSLMLLEIGLADVAAPDLVGRDAGLLGDDAGGELFGRHFQREEADDAAIDGHDVAVGAHLAAPGLGDVVGDVGGERGLAHAGAAGEDDQVGRLQAAHLAVEVVQAGGEAGELAVALVGVRRHVDRGGQRLREALEAAVVAAGLGQLVEPALGILDLVARREIDRRVEGDVDHVLADADQLAPDRQVVDGAAVVLGVDDGGGFGGEPREILADVQPADVDIGGRKVFSVTGVAILPARIRSRASSIDLLVDRLEEMLAARGNRRPGRTPRC